MADNQDSDFVPESQYQNSDFTPESQFQDQAQPAPPPGYLSTLGTSARKGLIGTTNSILDVARKHPFLTSFMTMGASDHVPLPDEEQELQTYQKAVNAAAPGAKENPTTASIGNFVGASAPLLGLPAPEIPITAAVSKSLPSVATGLEHSMVARLLGKGVDTVAEGLTPGAAYEAVTNPNATPSSIGQSALNSAEQNPVTHVIGTAALTAPFLGSRIVKSIFASPEYYTKKYGPAVTNVLGNAEKMGFDNDQTNLRNTIQNEYDNHTLGLHRLDPVEMNYLGKVSDDINTPMGNTATAGIDQYQNFNRYLGGIDADKRDLVKEMAGKLKAAHTQDLMDSFQDIDYPQGHDQFMQANKDYKEGKTLAENTYGPHSIGAHAISKVPHIGDLAAKALAVAHPLLTPVARFFSDYQGGPTSVVPSLNPLANQILSQINAGQQKSSQGSQ